MKTKKINMRTNPKPIRYSLTKKKCMACKKMKSKTSFRMLSDFNPSILSTSKHCKVCEKKHDKFTKITNRLIGWTQTIMRGGKTQTMIGFNNVEGGEKNMERDVETNAIINQKESVELTKNAKGDYQWKIKLLDDDIEQQIVRLARINDDLVGKYQRSVKVATAPPVT